MKKGNCGNQKPFCGAANSTSIRMKDGCYYSSSCQEIADIYLDGSKNGWYSKVEVHDYVKDNPNSIRVNIGQITPTLYTQLALMAKSMWSRQANDSPHDNLLKLTRH